MLIITKGVWKRAPCMQYHASSPLSLSLSHLPDRAVINGCSSTTRPVFPIRPDSARPHLDFSRLRSMRELGIYNRTELVEWHRDLLTVVLGTVMAPLALLRPIQELSAILEAGQEVPTGGAKTDYAILLLLTHCGTCRRSTTCCLAVLAWSLSHTLIFILWVLGDDSAPGSRLKARSWLAELRAVLGVRAELKPLVPFYFLIG